MLVAPLSCNDTHLDRSIGGHAVTDISRTYAALSTLERLVVDLEQAGDTRSNELATLIRRLDLLLSRELTTKGPPPISGALWSG